MPSIQRLQSIAYLLIAAGLLIFFISALLLQSRSLVVAGWSVGVIGVFLHFWVSWRRFFAGRSPSVSERDQPRHETYVLELSVLAKMGLFAALLSTPLFAVLLAIQTFGRDTQTANMVPLWFFVTFVVVAAYVSYQMLYSVSLKTEIDNQGTIRSVSALRHTEVAARDLEWVWGSARWGAIALRHPRGKIVVFDDPARLSGFVATVREHHPALAQRPLWLPWLP